MAQRRMFSPDIVCSEEFLDMPATSRELYFQLGMRADDDGFIQPKGVMRSINASTDDLKVLMTKRFVMPFESGVVVVKHWLIHNMIRGDRYKPTRFIEEKKALFLKDNKAYTDNPDHGVPLLATSRQPNGNQPAPQVRLGKGSLVAEAPAPVSVVKDEIERPHKPDKRVKDKEAVFHLFGRTKQPWWHHKQQKEAALRLFDRGLDKLKSGLEFMRENQDDQFCPQARTPFDYEVKLPKLNAYRERKEL